jgi:hypothetical protein
MASFVFGSLLGLATMSAESSLVGGITSAVSGGLLFEGGESLLKKGYKFAEKEIDYINKPSPLQNNDNDIYTPRQQRTMLTKMLTKK